MPNQQDKGYPTAAALEFIGERNQPLSPKELVARRPILGNGRVPETLLALNKRHSIFLSADAKAKPDVAIQWSEQPPGWRIDVALNETQQIGVIPGRTAARETSEVFLREIDRKVGFTGYRPEWMDQLFIPRLLPGQGRHRMRRMNGRPVNPLYVFGADERGVFQDSSYPWGCIGRVFNNEGLSGTGALVGKNLVVTAGHLVPWASAAAGSWWMRFVPAYFDGVSLHGNNVESYVSDTRGYNTSGDVAGYDWAILKLYNPLGDSLGHFGYTGYSDDWEDNPFWAVVGYPGAVAGAQRPSWQGGVSVFDDDSDSNGGLELETQADMTPGNSGGPMFAYWGGDPRIVGVVSGEEEDYIFGSSNERGNVVAGGSGFTNLVQWGRTNW